MRQNESIQFSMSSSTWPFRIECDRPSLYYSVVIQRLQKYAVYADQAQFADRCKVGESVTALCCHLPLEAVRSIQTTPHVVHSHHRLTTRS
jgi:hypothetical protein